MQHDNLIINAFRPLQLDKKSFPYVFENWEDVDFEKGELITQPGQIENSFYIVISGVQCIYILTKEGEKKVIGFSFDGSFSGVYDSFLKQTPSHYYLEALTASKLIRISKTVYDQFFEMYPDFNYWGRIAHQELLIGRVQREIELVTLSAKERFEKFSERCPKPLLQIPQKYLASYLNMTPETYSRMRKSIS